jgi:hypothetical protein
LRERASRAAPEKSTARGTQAEGSRQRGPYDERKKKKNEKLQEQLFDEEGVMKKKNTVMAVIYKAFFSAA